jgi:hypothetical protein
MSQVFEIYVIWINRSKICLCDAACFAGQTPLMRPDNDRQGRGPSKSNTVMQES